MDEVVKDVAAENKQRVADLNGLSQRQPRPLLSGPVRAGRRRTALLPVTRRTRLLIASSPPRRTATCAPPQTAVVGEPEQVKEQRQYSRAGAARAAINQLRPDTFTGDTEAGFAREVSDSIRQAKPVGPAASATWAMAFSPPAC